MKIESFRIGNLIKGRISAHSIIKIDKESVHSADVRVNDNSTHTEENLQISSIRPIPFDDKLVERLNLDFGADGFCLLFDDKNGQKVKLSDTNSLYVYGNANLDESQAYAINLSYLHEFQNLYFDLTGEEYIIKTKTVESLHTLW